MRKTARTWQTHIDAWKTSGLSQAEFCRRKELSYSKFRYHYHCRLAESADACVQSVFVPLAPAQMGGILADAGVGGESGVRLGINGISIELERGFCARTLFTVLKVLGKR